MAGKTQQNTAGCNTHSVTGPESYAATNTHHNPVGLDAPTDTKDTQRGRWAVLM